MNPPDIQKNTNEVARAAIDKRAPTTPEQKSASELRKVAESEKDSTDALKTIAKRVEDADLHQIAEASTSNINPDAKTGKRDTTEQASYDKVIRTGDVIRRYTETGNIAKAAERVNDKGTVVYAVDADRNALVQEMRGAVLRMAEQVPGADAVFKDPSTGLPIAESERNKIITDLMNDPEFMAFVKLVHSERTDPQVIRQELAAAMVARRKYEQTVMAQERAQRKHGEISTQITNTNTELTKYNVDTAGKAIGSEAVKQEKLQGQLETFMQVSGVKVPEAQFRGHHEPLIRAAQGKVSAMETNLARLPYTATADARKKAADALASAHADLATAEQPIKSLEGFKTQIKAIDDRNAQLESQKTTLEDQLVVAADALADAKHDTIYAKADFDVVDPNQNLSANALMTEAARRYFVDTVDNLNDVQKIKLAKELADATDAAQKRVMEDISKKWTQEEDRTAVGKFFKGDRGLVVDEAALKIDFDKLMTGGPNALREGLGYHYLDSAGNVRKDTAGNPIGLNDEQWVSVQDFAIQQLIQRKLSAGGLKTGEAEHIFNSPWGNDVIGKAIAEKNRFTTDVLGKMQAAGVLEGQDQGSIRKFIGKHPGWSTLLMMVLLGVVALPAGVVAGTLISGAGGVGGIISSVRK